MATRTRKLGLNRPADRDQGWGQMLRDNADVLDQAVGAEHKPDGRHGTVNADRISVGGEPALADGEIAAKRIKLPGGYIDNPNQAVSQSLKGAIDGGAGAALNPGQPFELLDPSGSRQLFIVDPDRGLSGMLGNIANPLVKLPLKRAEEITGTAAAAGAQFSGVATFTRASAGTYIDPMDGLVKTAVIDAPRFELGAGGGIGLLREESSTNILTYSRGTAAFPVALDNPNDSFATDATIADPWGTGQAGKLLIGTDMATNHRLRAQSGTLSAGTYTFSVDVRAQNVPGFLLWFWSANESSKAFFDMTTGSVVSNTGINAGIQPLTNGWYRIWIVHDVVTSGTFTMMVYANGVPGSMAAWAGDGSTTAIWVDNAQLEAMPFPTSRIETTGVVATRAPDSFAIPIAGNAIQEMVIVVDVAPVLAAGAQIEARPILDLRGAATEEAPLVKLLPNTDNLHVIAGGVGIGTVAATGNFQRVAIRVGPSGYDMFVDGQYIASAPKVSGLPFTTSSIIRIGHALWGGSFCGHISNVRVYDRGMSDVEMAAA